MKYSMLFLWVSLLCVSFVYAAEPDALALFATCQQETFKRGEPISITLTFKNTGSRNLKLYQPPSLDIAARDWYLSFLVIRPDGSRFRLTPIARTGASYTPRREDYRELETGATFTVPIVWGDSALGGQRQDTWEALRQITPQEAGASRERLAQKFNISGDYFIRHDGSDYLVLRDLILDVFNMPGEYTIMIEYANASVFCMFDDGRSTMRNWEKIEDAWTGTISSEARVTIAQ